MTEKKKLKILHLIDCVGHGGAEVVFSSLIDVMGGVHYEHHVVLPEKGWLYNQLQSVSGIDASLYNGRGHFNLKYIRYLMTMIKDNDIDVVHSHLFGTSLYSSMAGFLCRVPVVCTFHGFIDVPEQGWFTHLKLNLIGMFASRIVTVSNGLKDYTATMASRWQKKFITIYNGVDLGQKSKLSRAEARKFEGYSENAILVGAIGNVKKEKGYDVLIRTAGKVLAEVQNCQFIIAGNQDDNVYKELVALRKELKLESSVQFVGYQKDVSNFLKSLDVYVLTSDSEGFSLAIIEAMNASIPVVATRCGGPQEIISNNTDGILTDVGDVTGLALGIQTLLMDREGRERLTQNAARTVQERFSLGTMVSSYENLYRSLVCHKQRGEECE